MLGPNVVVVEPTRLVDRQLNSLFCAGGQSYLRLRRIAAAVLGTGFAREPVQVHLQSSQYVRRDAREVVQQPKQQMVRDDRAMPQSHGFLLRNLQRPTCPVSELVEAVSHGCAGYPVRTR